jgi:hypothetical protein
MIALSACNLVMATPGNGSPSLPTPELILPTANLNTPSLDPQMQIDLAVSQTFDVQTQIARAVQETMAAMVTDTPERPSETPSPISTLTPEVPRVSVSIETNCRSGPGTGFDKLGILFVGQTAEVVGRSVYNDNWIIKLPSNPAITCWLWGQYATVVGITSGLPAINPPPTPTPAGSFNVVYASTGACAFSTYAIKFQIANTGSVTWESNRVTATDQVTSETKEYSWDNFPNYNDIGCALISADLHLDPGESGYTSTMAFSANPAGHSITATFRICSLDGLAGVCLEKTITFIP